MHGPAPDGLLNSIDLSCPYESRLQLFIKDRLGEYKANKVNTSMIKTLLESVGGGATNVTRKQYYRYVRMFFRWCVQEKHIKEDPTDSLRACFENGFQGAKRLTIRRIMQIRIIASL